MYVYIYIYRYIYIYIYMCVCMEQGNLKRKEIGSPWDLKCVERQGKQ